MSPLTSTNQWHPNGHRMVSMSATCGDLEMIHEWVNMIVGEFPPEGYGTIATVLPTNDGYLARVERSIHCD